jgi:multidrug efflux pump
MALFFIDRPIFAWVIAIIIMLAGIISISALPVAQYPEIAPPSVTITARYPGASARTVEDAVTQVIEQRMKGIDNLDYMRSTSDSNGQAQIVLTFNSSADPDIAQVQVQNKLQLAMPSLPREVQEQGITVAKANNNFLMAISLIATDGSMTGSDLIDYLIANLQDPISRVNGVGDVQVFGSQYAIRIWLNPNRLHYYRMTPSDVLAAVRAQNAQVPAGQFGQAPFAAGQQINVTINAQDRLQRPEEFEQILLRVEADGSSVLLRDVARVELGQEDYFAYGRYNGQPAGGMAIRLASGANALATAMAVEARLKELEPYFPPGVEIVNAFDTTPTVRASVYEVVKTLFEAIALVFLVMYLFLQNFRATLIPTIAVPVVLLGTFAILAACGFSINTLTMFGMVLAIGLLVDDAIVVVENVERIMAEEHLSPVAATRKSMGQITGALVGIAMVLSAVFVPMAFFGGSTGVIYRQFSITIVSAMGLSVLIALILTPALCATILTPHKEATYAQGGFFGWFNRVFNASIFRYARVVGGIAGRPRRMMLIYVLIAGVMAFLFMRMPSSYLPDEDQGVMFAMVQLPASSTLAQTQSVMEQMERYLLEQEKDTVLSVMCVVGVSFSGMGQNMGMSFIRLRDWSERTKPSQHVMALAQRCMGVFSRIRNGLVFAFIPSPVIVLGTSTGFTFELQDTGGIGHQRLTEARDELLTMAKQNPLLRNVRSNGMDDTPQYRIAIDNKRAAAHGLSLAEINADIAAAFGGAYVNDFIDKGRVKKVYAQADAPYRMMPGDLDAWHFRNAGGAMVPFSSIATSHWMFGPARLERYNGVPSMEILGEAAAGESSGTAMRAMQDLAAKLPDGTGHEWSSLSFQERLSGNQMPLLFSISILVVFLCLAALYESWSVPFAVIMVVPLGVLGAVLAATGRGLANDVYFQIGILATIGLAAKNAILIVEFAKTMYESNEISLIEAVTRAARLRLRPILMTSLAFGVGVLPLAVSSGAGAGGQRAVGTGVLGGTIAATALGIFMVPVFFVVVNTIFRRARKKKAPAPDAGDTRLDSPK